MNYLPEEWNTHERNNRLCYFTDLAFNNCTPQRSRNKFGMTKFEICSLLFEIS
jgi:hypothetical protein